MSWKNGKLDNINYTAIDSHEEELNTALQGIRENTKSLKQDIEEMNKSQLIQVIERNFKDKSGNWLPYSPKNPWELSIKTSPAYAFITQAAIDMLGEADPYLDDQLKANKGIDMDYGKGTRALVRRVEAWLGITVDKWYAWKEFFDAVIKYLNGKWNYDVTKAEQVTTSTPTPQRRPNGEKPSPNPVPTPDPIKRLEKISWEELLALQIKNTETSLKSLEQNKMPRGLSYTPNSKKQEYRLWAPDNTNWSYLDQRTNKTLSYITNSREWWWLTAFHEQKEIMQRQFLHETFESWKHRTPEKHQIRDDMNTGFTKRNPNEHGDIVITWFGGTDGTPVNSGTTELTPKKYQDKEQEIITLLKKSTIPNRNQIIQQLDNDDFFTWFSGFTNVYLVGMRNLEMMKVAIEEYAKNQNMQTHKPELYFNYLGLFDRPWLNKNKKEERFIQGEMDFLKKEEPEPHNIDIIGNVDWIPLKMNEELDVMKRENPDKIWNKERDMNNELKADINQHLVTIKTWNPDTQCNCGDSGNACEYDWTTWEVYVCYGSFKRLLPFKLPTLTCDTNGVPIENGTNSQVNQQVVKTFARLGNIMNCLKYKGCLDPKQKNNPIEWDFSLWGYELQVKDGDIDDTTLLDPDTVEELDRWFWSYGMNFERCGANIAWLLNAIKLHAKMITLPDLQTKLNTNEYNDFVRYK